MKHTIDNQADGDEILLTFVEVMRRLKCSRSTVLRLIQNGDLKAYKVGAKWRFYPSDVKNAIKHIAI